jgi:hypothetical protein
MPLVEVKTVPTKMEIPARNSFDDLSRVELGSSRPVVHAPLWGARAQNTSTRTNRERDGYLRASSKIPACHIFEHDGNSPGAAKSRVIVETGPPGISIARQPQMNAFTRHDGNLTISRR